VGLGWRERTPSGELQRIIRPSMVALLAKHQATALSLTITNCQSRTRALPFARLRTQRVKYNNSNDTRATIAIRRSKHVGLPAPMLCLV
jgi:hypothetical protein